MICIRREGVCVEIVCVCESLWCAKGARLCESVKKYMEFKCVCFWLERLSVLFAKNHAKDDTRDPSNIHAQVDIRSVCILYISYAYNIVYIHNMCTHARARAHTHGHHHRHQHRRRCWERARQDHILVRARAPSHTHTHTRPDK